MRLILAAAVIVSCRAGGPTPGGSAPTAIPPRLQGARATTSAPLPATAPPEASVRPTDEPRPYAAPTLAPMETPPSREDVSPLSPMEEMRERALAFEPWMRRVSADAETVDHLFDRYIGFCYDKFSGRRWADRASHPTPHEWLLVPTADFAWQERWVDPLGQLPYLGRDAEICESYWETFASEARAVALALDDLKEEARKKGVLPGHLDELLERHGLPVG